MGTLCMVSLKNSRGNIKIVCEHCVKSEEVSESSFDFLLKVISIFIDNVQRIAIRKYHNLLCLPKYLLYTCSKQSLPINNKHDNKGKTDRMLRSLSHCPHFISPRQRLVTSVIDRYSKPKSPYVIGNFVQDLAVFCV